MSEGETRQQKRDTDDHKRSLRRIRVLALVLAVVSWGFAVAEARYSAGKEHWLFAGLGVMWVVVAHTSHGFLKKR